MPTSPPQDAKEFADFAEWMVRRYVLHDNVTSADAVRERAR